MSAGNNVFGDFPTNGFDAGARERFSTWRAAGGAVPGLPEEGLLPDGMLRDLALRVSMPKERLDALRAAVAHLEGDRALWTVTRFLAFDLCTDRSRYDGMRFDNPKPGAMGRHAGLYPLLLCLACIPVSREMCRNRGIPDDMLLPVAERVLEPQLRHFSAGGDDIVDFPWDLNFYTGSIFLIGRFSFILTPYDDDVDFWRNRETGQVLGLYDGERAFRRDGQFQGVNGVVDREPFLSVRRLTDSTVTAHPVKPMGFLEREPVTLARAVWERTLHRGEWTLGLHIPSGPGYDPEQLRSAAVAAFAFFDRYFPEKAALGLWSESWLYDARLSLCMGEERNIVRVQRQMYLYPMERDDAMLRLELFGSGQADLSAFEPRTGLQRDALAYMQAGGRFNTGGMVILREDTGRIGDMPYIRAQDVARFRETVDAHLRPGLDPAWQKAGR